MTFRIRGTVGRMGDISRNTRDIPFFEVQRFLSAVKFHIAAPGVADSYFQTIVEMKGAAWNARYFPVFA